MLWLPVFSSLCTTLVSAPLTSSAIGVGGTAGLLPDTGVPTASA